MLVDSDKVTATVKVSEKKKARKRRETWCPGLTPFLSPVKGGFRPRLSTAPSDGPMGFFSPLRRGGSSTPSASLGGETGPFAMASIAEEVDAEAGSGAVVPETPSKSILRARVEELEREIADREEEAQQLNTAEVCALLICCWFERLVVSGRESLWLAFEVLFIV